MHPTIIRTFSIATLGCKVNQYESDQITALLQSYGLQQVASSGDLQIVNTCSVTVQAASKSRQTIRRASKGSRAIALPVISAVADSQAESACVACDDGESPYALNGPVDFKIGEIEDVKALNPNAPFRQPQIVVTGCWATSDPQAAANLPNVSAVITHHDDVLTRLKDFLSKTLPNQQSFSSDSHAYSKARDNDFVNKKIGNISPEPRASATGGVDAPENYLANKRPITDARGSDDACSTGTISLPLLSKRQHSHQRAFLKIQDGCDAHCTYCIIPQLRPKLWSKPIEDCVFEAQNMVDVGHDEIVLTGIFMGAYGQPTALRRHQQQSTAIPLGELVDALCTKVHGLKRLRLSSLEPGDLTPELLSILKSHRQVVPHFHLPLQSGSDVLLRKMNRQYTSSDFMEMIEQVQQAFDRPAFTTDIIVGFPGETDGEFEKTIDVARRSGFIHIHGFSYSARPKTAAARWKKDFVHGPIVNERINRLNDLAKSISFEYRKTFAGETVELLVEKKNESDQIQHGRCERYFAVHFESAKLRTGELLRARITNVTPEQTIGEII